MEKYLELIENQDAQARSLIEMWALREPTDEPDTVEALLIYLGVPKSLVGELRAELKEVAMSTSHRILGPK